MVVVVMLCALRLFCSFPRSSGFDLSWLVTLPWSLWSSSSINQYVGEDASDRPHLLDSYIKFAMYDYSDLSLQQSKSVHAVTLSTLNIPDPRLPTTSLHAGASSPTVNLRLDHFQAREVRVTFTEGRFPVLVGTIQRACLWKRLLLL